MDNATYEICTYRSDLGCYERVLGSKNYGHVGQAKYAARAAAGRLGETVFVMSGCEEVYEYGC